MAMTVCLMCDTVHGRAGSRVTVDQREADRLIRAGVAFPIERRLTPETATVVPPESAAARVSRPVATRRRKGQ